VAALRTHTPEERRAIAGLLLGSVFSLAPGLSGLMVVGPDWVSDRNLLVFSIGVALYWALVLRQAFQWSQASGRLHLRLVGAVAAVAVLGLTLVWSPIRLRSKVADAAGFLTLLVEGGESFKGKVGTWEAGLHICEENRNIVWLRNPFPEFPAWGGAALHKNGEELRPQVVLGEVETPLVAARLGPRRITLRGERVTQHTGRRPLEPGQRLAVPIGEVRVIEVSGEFVTSIEVELVKEIEEHCFLSADPEGTVSRVALPPSGQSIEY
jgi:hypothetical protein